MNPHPDDSHPERDSAERHHHRDPYPTGTPHHSNAGSLPIHQPVASRVSGAIHSPGGLLANHGSSAPPLPLGAPATAGAYGPESNRPHPHNAQNASSQMYSAISAGPSQLGAGPGGVTGSSAPFGGPLPHEAGSRPPQGMPFGGVLGGPAPSAAQGQQAQGNSGALAQGQQPILNVSAFDFMWRTAIFGRP